MRIKKEDWKSILATRLKTARGILTHRQVSAECGIQESRISQIENSKAGCPTPLTIYRLAMATDRKPTEWFESLGTPITDSELEILEKDCRFRPIHRRRDWF